MPLELTKENLATQLLVNTVQELSLAKNIDDVMNIVRRVARKLTGADGASFVLRDGDMCHYADEDAISPLWKGNRFPMRTCISGWVMLNKSSVVIEDIYKDERIPADAYRPTFVKSLAMVPIRTIDPLGAIGNYWADHHIPTQEEITLLQALADITAVSMESIATRNILEEKVIERTRALADLLLREKKRNETKGAFVSMAAHEFRTPLQTILTSTSLVEKYVEENEAEKCLKHFERIKTSVNHLKLLMTDYLSIDKLEQGKISVDKIEFDLKELLQDIVEEMTAMRKIGQMLRYNHNGQNMICSDKKTLRNIMLNLISNAIKYSEKDVTIESDVNEEAVTINVIDRGIGIPDDQHAKVFGRFFRANNVDAIEGTGLGLSIVQQYVSLLGGYITFTSKEGIGTTFHIQLPVK